MSMANEYKSIAYRPVTKHHPKSLIQCIFNGGPYENLKWQSATGRFY